MSEQIPSSAPSENTEAQSQEQPKQEPQRNVKKIRLEREFAVLDQKAKFEGKKHLKYQHFPDQYAVVINKVIKIQYGAQFPFETPKVIFQLDQDKEKYPAHLCLFDLNKMEFRDIMKEDFHPSLNFAEIADRSQQFLDKNVITLNDGGSISGWLLNNIQKIEHPGDGINWLAPLIVMLLHLLFIIIEATQLLTFHDQAQNRHSYHEMYAIHDLLRKFGFSNKAQYIGQLDPFADNLLYCYLLKGMSFLIAAVEEIKSDKARMPLFQKLPNIDDKFEMFIFQMMVGTMGLCLQYVILMAPIQLLVDIIYKKNSALFKFLLILVCCTTCSIYTSNIIMQDFQVILFAGLTLWSQVFLCSDNVVGSLIAYGLSLNSSLDALIYLPFFTYRILCKVLKQVYKDQGIYLKHSPHNGSSHLYNENNLDIGLLQTFLGELHTCLMAFLFGYFGCWAPWFYVNYTKQIGVTPPQIFNRSKGGFDPLYDPLIGSVYGHNTANPHSLWHLVLGKSLEKLSVLEIPLLMHLFWISATNLLVILFTRSNKLLSSHKKHILQLFLVIQINFFFGTPKFQSSQGVLMILTILPLLIFSEFTTVALIFSISVHFTDMDFYLDNTRILPFFGMWVLHFLIAAPLLRHFLNICVTKQLEGKNNIVGPSVDEEETSNQKAANIRRQKNEAFRVQNGIIKQMTLLKGKYGLSWFLLNYQDYLFYFYIIDFPFFSMCKLLGYMTPIVENIQQTHLLVKGIILMIMNVECLLAHIMGPITRKSAKTADKKSQGGFKGPFKVQPPVENQQEDSAMGLEVKEKES